MAKQTIPLILAGAGTSGDPMLPVIPTPPEGQFLQSFCIDEAEQTVTFEYADIPTPPEE